MALGASCVQAADESYVSAEAVRPWSVSAALRGFYDDNINTVATDKQDVLGFSITPQISLGWQGEQTTVNASYNYSLLYYDEKPFQNTQNYDQDHTFNGFLSHRFTERYQVQVVDSFVLGQEPDKLRSGDTTAVTQRVPGDNIRNYGSISFTAQLTRLLGLEAGYGNSFFDYHAKGARDGKLQGIYFDPSGTGTNIVHVGDVQNILPSISGNSDRIEHSFHLNSRWQLTPQTVGVVGYRYAQTVYTGDEPIGVLWQLNTNALTLNQTQLMSDSRNTRSHYGYLGLEHTFSPDLFASANAGFSTTDAYNDPSHPKYTSPYATASLSYAYAPQCSLQAGLGYGWSSTDLVGIPDLASSTNRTTSGSFTVGSKTANVFASINHRITPRLYATISGQLQDSTFVGGVYDGKSERYYLVGLNLQYHLHTHLLAEVGYNYDKVDSDVGRGYDRNRIYVGLTGSY
jgi:hypothetical protein